MAEPVPAGDPERAALERAAAQAREPFDLGDGPLVRVTVTPLSPTEHLLAMYTHHIASDGWSVGVLMRDLQAAYAGGRRTRCRCSTPTTPPGSGGGSTVTCSATRCAFGPRPWRRRPRHWTCPPTSPSGDGQLAGARLRDRLDPRVVDRLREIARDAGTTLFSALYAAFGAVLMRRSGQDAAVVGVPVAGRSRAEAEDLIGFFVNTLPIPVRLPEDGTFGGLLTQVAGTVLGAFEHQDVPFERLVETLAPERDLSRNPLFQAMFVLQNTPSSPTRFGDVDLEQVPLEPGTAKFDLTLSVEEREEAVVELEYATDLFTPETARAVLDAFLRLCAGAAERPSAPLADLMRIPAEERERLLVTWNRTDRDDPAPTSSSGCGTSRPSRHRPSPSVTTPGTSPTANWPRAWTR
ncbi:condensation domain-containing protein [Streptomyces sp. M19]